MWFYAGNMLPALAVHNNSPPVPNDRWEKDVLTPEEKEKIHPFLDQIAAMKLRGLNGVSVIASFIRRRVQPLRERVNYGFEYTGLDDPTQMSRDKLFEDEVLERIHGILKGVTVLPLKFEEYELQRPPPAVSVTSC